MRLWVAGILALGGLSQAQAEEYSQSYTVSGRPTVQVHVDDSRVRIVTDDTQQVKFNVSRDGSFSGLRIDSHQDGNHVELSVLHEPKIAFVRTEHHLMTEVRMPRDADLEV